jgi:hypothetical protein
VARGSATWRVVVGLQEASLKVAPPSGSAVLPDVVHQNATHRTGGNQEEVTPIPPVDASEAHELHIGLVNRSRRTEGMTHPLTLQVPVGDPPGLRIYGGVQPVCRFGLTIAKLEQQVGDLLGFVHAENRRCWTVGRHHVRPITGRTLRAWRSILSPSAQGRRGPLILGLNPNVVGYILKLRPRSIRAKLAQAGITMS